MTARSGPAAPLTSWWPDTSGNEGRSACRIRRCRRPDRPAAGSTPSAAGISTAGMSCTGVSRHGSDVDHCRRSLWPRTANATSSGIPVGGPGRREIPFVAQQRGVSSTERSAAGRARRRTSASRAAADHDRSPELRRDLTEGELAGAARFTGPLPIPGSTAARTKTRCASSLCTTCTCVAPVRHSGNNADANARRTQLSTPRPRIARTSDRHPLGAARRDHLFGAGLVLPVGETGCSWSASVNGVAASRSAP